MDIYTLISEVIEALHVLAGVLWVGGLIFLTGVLFPFRQDNPSERRSTFFNAVVGFRPYLYSAMGVSVLSGIWRVTTVPGGMAGIPPVIHIKILFALIMVGLCLVSYLNFVPKIQASVKDGKVKTTADPALKALLWCLSVAALLGVAIFFTLAFGGFFN